MNKRFRFIIISIFSVFWLAACGSQEESADGTENTEPEGEPVEGGTLNVAYPSEPDTLDWMATSATPTRDIAWHIFEPLLGPDSDYQVQPVVAEDFTVSEDETLYTITLRDDVTFHDGSDVTAEDVVASLDRWRTVSSVGQESDKYIDSVTIVDDQTIEIQLTEVYNAFLSDMSAPKSALMIIPEEIAEEAGEQPLTPEQLVGTGPYQFDEWNRGSDILLSKYEDYSPREEEDLGGLAGQKNAYFDALNFEIVKDPQVAINGIKTDLYDYALSIPNDLYDVAESDPSIDSVSYINGYSTITPDKSEAPFDDIQVREALNLALDKEAMAEATYGNSDFYSFDGALFDPEQTQLYSEEGTEEYLNYDPERAKELLEESDYNGETLKVLHSNDSEIYKRISQVMQQQLEEVGFSIELVPLEWATYLEQWSDPSNWDLVVVGWSTRFSPNELGQLVNDTNSSGWYDSERWRDLVDDWAVASDDDERADILSEMNQTVWDELPFIKVANETRLDIKGEQVQLEENWVGPKFWGSWKNQ
ncbi:ABC transporter substrate-binding protein [Oceanobacillus timonensis]|uniref:ABC transporter substrate-binding protein n=1 Tax=Oceanobacillus timonensis TaxID=1926285 RepID=UPI0009BB4135|nr:ABC transporter substrate-binding protein [Oceanobacillus timonensis]